jgi:hypothetical protein
MAKVPVKAEYPPSYPHSNELDNHSQQAKKSWISNGGLPIPTTDPKAGTDQYYQKAGEGHADVAKNKTNNRGMKKADAKTIGSKVFNGAKSATDFVKNFDPQNTSGSIPFALNLIKQIQTGSGVNKILSDIVGSQLNGIISQFTDLLKQNLPQQANALVDLINKGLELKERIEQLKSNPTADPQLISEFQTQYDEIQQKISQLNNNQTTV